MWVIAQSNNMSNPSVIYPGQLLSIPNSDSLTRVDNSGIPSAKSVVVDISEQRTYIFENGVTLQVFVVSTGVPGQDTMRGSFSVQNRIPMAYAATWDLQMPYWVGFYWAGPLQNGFHALPILSDGSRLWGGLLGMPASYGCVILSEEDAQWLYGWVDIGTPVVVQD
jgi:lipoprotein-anchoring transpeptidase ErfK/SrfK